MLPPVLQRELLVRARRGSTIWIRLGIYLLALMLVALLLIPAMAMGAMTGMGMASVDGELLLEAPPFVHKAVPLEDGVERAFIEVASLDELHDAHVILQAASIERDGHEVLGGKDADGKFINIADHGVCECFRIKRLFHGQKLNGPSLDADVFALGEIAACREVLVDRGGADAMGAFLLAVMKAVKNP